MYNILPQNYSFKIVKMECLSNSNGLSVQLRLKLNTKEEVLLWLSDFQEKNHITFRVLQTYEENTQKILFKVSYQPILFHSLPTNFLHLLYKAHFLFTYPYFTFCIIDTCSFLLPCKKCYSFL